MKNQYSKPEVEIIEMECADVIVTSIGEGIGDVGVTLEQQYWHLT